MKRFVIAVYVENKYGVLTRVSGMFMRKGFNIDSLTVGETDDPAYSRITITLRGDEYAREQLINQLKKLYNVKQVKLLDGESSVEREMALIKVQNTPTNRSEIMAATEIYRAKIIDYTTDTYDGGVHLNVFGAEKLTSYFGDILVQKYGLSDRRGEAEFDTLWAEKLAIYQKERNGESK